MLSMKTCLSQGILLLALLFVGVSSSTGQVPPPELNVMVPEADTSIFAAPRHRVAANTDPANRAFINGEEARVYASGAFVGVVQLEFGENPLVFRVETPDGRSAERRLVIHRPAPPSPLDPSRLEIDEASIMPVGRLWLTAGEVLEVRFRGSPGRRATFEVRGMTPRVPMTELPLEETGGLPGIYAGRYVIQPDDEVLEAPVVIRMRGRGLAASRAQADARVTVAPYDTPRVVEVIGERPFLNAGLGTDRLGGARLGSIDPGVRLRVDGRRLNQYRVRLADGVTAWLPTRFAHLLPPETPQPRLLVGSVTVRGEGRDDIVETALQQRIPYVASHQSSPARIVVDLFGAVSNTNWITHLQSSEGIEHVSWKQVGEEHYRLFVELTHEGRWGFDVGYVRQSTLRIRVRRPPVVASEDRPLEGMTLVVDAGHGGPSNGAIGAAGTLEKDVTLAISQRLERLLIERGASVEMLRTRDVNVPMGERIDRTIAIRPDILVSIHANSTGLASDPKAVRGTSSYYRHEEFR
ncbi:MAG: N-acetylmuramoyl-L-alanine amidase, partial [Bacteroidota bacterium]